ncbi:phage head completion protein [Methylocella silvestris]|uniref:Phage head-tail adaptor n=1 Tax=Methylocella silvestris TaxID=199596 RepID=A0A2J7TJU9_METSI|nr:head-tail adaptor protein [Methylocella silvestris]PNG27007.1 hypothetical protein CR492_04705 [Methylocella silvestris]
MRYGPNPVLIDVMRRSTDANSVRGAFAKAQTLMGSLRQTTGRELVEAGLPEDQIDIVVRVSITAQTLAITSEDRLNIGGRNYAIRSVGLPERRGGYIEIACGLSIGN